jgi:DNA modification methylase
MTELIHGDCIEVLRAMPDCSVDAVVTDPPYGLSFMGKKWDYDVPRVEVWAECLRVLKPGGHLLAFAGTRTQHRMAVRIEDAGFEIRDMIAYVYGSGFPKNHDIGKKLCHCDRPEPNNHYICGHGTESQTQRDVRQMRQTDISQAVDNAAQCREVLQSSVSEHDASLIRAEGSEPETAGGKQSGMEGRRNAIQEEGQLHRGVVRKGAILGIANGTQRRLHHAASAGHGSDVRTFVDTDRSGTPFRSQSIEQQPRELGTVAVQRQSQKSRVGEDCAVCGKPIGPFVAKGWGTALKPALEPITVARKPLIGTVAENVLQYGTGAINVDGGRVGDNAGWSYPNGRGGTAWHGRDSLANNLTEPMAATQGRWPANFIHDGSEEATDLLKDSARFFYCAKASKADRGENNHHPTVKPTDLMRYLCRLVTPLNGVVLDPFMGSGSTGKAAALEGFSFIGIEREAEYVAIAQARINHVTND